MLAALDRADRAVLRVMRTRLHGRRTERVAIALTRTGEMGALWMALALAGAAVDRSQRGRWLRVAAAVQAALGVNSAVKSLTRRARPSLPGLPGLGRVPTTGSLPSGHAAMSFAFATASARLCPPFGPPAFTAAALMALTRPYLGVHYPSDVVAGAALGTLIGWVCAA